MCIIIYSYCQLCKILNLFNFEIVQVCSRGNFTLFNCSLCQFVITKVKKGVCNYCVEKNVAFTFAEC